jgi:predicted nucleic acid-binding protein
MIILDNSVLSAFTRLKILSLLRKLIKKALISPEIILEYSQEWAKKIPKWIIVQKANEKIPLQQVPSSLSPSDISLIKLAIAHKKPLASDDKPLRNFARQHGVAITGSLGLLKQLYLKRIIPSREKYLALLKLLQDDVFISDDLMKWALEE